MGEYFAKKSASELVDDLIDKKLQYYRYLSNIGRSLLLRRVHQYFNKSIAKRGTLSRSGSVGQYVNVNVNHFRNLVDHRKSLLVNQRPAYDAKAINSDSSSESQVLIANGLLEYYGRVKKLDRIQEQAAEAAIKYGEGFVYVGWNPTGGKQYGIHPQTGAVIYEGDLEFNSYTTFDVVRDVHLRESGQDRWFLVRKRKNKYELAEAYGLTDEQKQQVLDEEMHYDNQYVQDFEPWTYVELQSGDIINEWCFYHAADNTMPQGRMIKFTEGGVVLFDGPLPYRRLPLLRMSAGEVENSPFGTTNTFDLVPLQETLDKLYSIAVTNNATFGVQNVAIPRGSGLTVTKIPGGLNYLEYDAKFGKPEPLQLTATPVEVYKLIEMIEQKMETLSGINSAARGEPDNNLRSANSVALVQTMAIQFAQALQVSYAHMLEDSGMMVIENLQDYAEVPKVAEIVGINNRSYLKEFKSGDINQINRIAVDLGNPISKTVAGRSDMANNMLQYGIITTPQEYIEVQTTGRLDPVTQGPMSEMILIRQENEAMMAGQSVPVIDTDDHVLHLKENKVIGNDLKVRTDPQRLQNWLQHMAQHRAMAQMQQMAAMQAGQPPQGPQPQQNQQPSPKEQNK